jgi:hypothetical protein
LRTRCFFLFSGWVELVVSVSVDWLGAGGSSLVPNRTSHRPSWSDSLNHLLLWVLLQSPFFGGKRWGSEQQQSNIISSLTFSLRPASSLVFNHPPTKKQTNKQTKGESSAFAPSSGSARGVRTSLDATIKSVKAREILDSRGNPTVEVRFFVRRRRRLVAIYVIM